MLSAEPQDPRLAHRCEARTQDVRGVPARGELRRAQREMDADLWIRGDVRRRAAGELATAGVPRLRARVASLDEGVGGDCGDDGERDEARTDDSEQSASLSPGANPLAPQLLPGLPRQDRRPQHVVEDLVASRRALHPVHAADDALAPERVEQLPKLRVLYLRVLGEIGRLVRDLSPRRRHELPNDARRRLLLGKRQSIERSLDVLPDDRTCSADRAQRLEAQLPRPRLPFALPQALEHELEVRRLDPGLGRGLVEHRLDECVLGRERLARQLAEAGERAEDRRTPCVPVEQVEAQQVREQLGNAAGEVVELGQGVVPHREQDVDAEARPPQKLRQRRAEWPFDPVIEDVLLEVVEQQVQLAVLLRRGSNRVDEAGRRSELAALRADGRDQAGSGILGPRVVHHHRCAAELSQPPRHAGAEQRALADAARPVEHGEPAREDVRRHGRDLSLAAEEEQRVELGILERGESLVRALWYSAHDAAAFASARSSSATYAAGAMSTTSTSRRRQNSRSSGCSPGCTDHERYGSGSLPQSRSSTTRSVQVESV